MQSTYLLVDDGSRLHYVTSGTGAPALVFVHGWCSNATHFADQMQSFSVAHRVLAIDRRGHGRSDAPPTGYSVERHAADLGTVLDHEQLGKVVIVGHAGGCPSVLRFAVDHPERCLALVLLDTRISPSADLRGADSDSPLAQMIENIADDETFARIYRGFVADQRRDLTDRVVAEAMTVPRRVAQEDLASIAVDTVALASKVSCPVLWLTAEPADQAALREVFGDIEFVHVSNSGHFVQLEVPDQVNAAIAEFLTRLAD